MLCIIMYCYVVANTTPSSPSIHPIHPFLSSVDRFDRAVLDTARALVPLTIDLWRSISNKLLPTPARFHYIFNMRDLSKVWCVWGGGGGEGGGWYSMCV